MTLTADGKLKSMSPPGLTTIPFTICVKVMDFSISTRFSLFALGNLSVRGISLMIELPFADASGSSPVTRVKED